MGLLCFTESTKKTHEIMDLCMKKMHLKNIINESWGLEKLKYYLIFIQVDNELKRKCGVLTTNKKHLFSKNNQHKLEERKIL